jgi:hypothetical protein
MARMRIVLLLALVASSTAVACSQSSLEPSNDSTTPAPVTDDDSELNAAAAANEAAIGRAAHAKLRELAPKVTLGMFGEDSGSACTANFRRGPADRLSAEEVLRLFQFNVQEQLASGELDFHSIAKDDADTWESFESSQLDDEGIAAARAIKELYTGPDVKEIAVMIPNDRYPFSASVYLVARMKDGSLLALRGTVGGMAF